MNLSRFDLNLILALDVLLRERSVTVAAKCMGITQPAMSHTLTRLRDVLGDPLLVRVGRQMVLTDRGESLIEQVTALIRALENLFCPTPPVFNAKESTQCFRVVASEYAQLIMIPSLYALLSAEAPHASLHVLPFDELDITQALRSSKIDLALGPLPPDGLPTDIHTEELSRDRLVGVAAVSNPRANRPDIETYLAASHLAVSPFGTCKEAIDELLARRGLSRRIAMTVPNVLLAPFVVVTSDLVMTLPERIAMTFTSALSLRRFDPPIDMNSPDALTLMMWHERMESEPAHQWFRQVVSDAAVRAVSTYHGKRGWRTRPDHADATGRATRPG